MCISEAALLRETLEIQHKGIRCRKPAVMGVLKASLEASLARRPLNGASPLEFDIFYLEERSRGFRSLRST